MGNGQSLCAIKNNFFSNFLNDAIMLKNSIFSLIAISVLTLFSCDKIATIIVDRGIGVEVSVNAMSAGQTFSKDTTLVTAPIKLLLKEKGGSNVVLEILRNNGATLTIPDSSPWTFADIESVEVFLEGKSIGTLPPGATGKTMTLAVPANAENLATQYKNSDTLNIKVTMKAKNATTATKLTLTVTFHIEAAVAV